MMILLKSALLLVSIFAVAGNSTSSTSFEGCPIKCGDLTVPYPFGISSASACSINPSFDIICDVSTDPPKAFLASASALILVLGISETNIRIQNQPAMSCYQDNGTIVGTDFGMNFSGTPFSFSNENKLTAVGCDDVAFVLRNPFDPKADDVDLITSCVAICSKLDDLSNGFCSGIGCCQSSIPKGVQSIYSTMTTLSDRSKVPELSSCGYSFLAEQNSYTFNVSDISDPSFFNKTTDTVPIVLDWAIGNRTCNQIMNTSEMICQQNSVCVDSGTTLGGYRCNCSQGYQGNPYLSPGCQDIDECKSSPCVRKAKCSNSEGSFYCTCPPRHYGDGTKRGTGCNPFPREGKFAMYIGLLVGLGSFTLLLASFMLYRILKKSRLKQLKGNHFKRNGGLLLQQQSSARDSVLDRMRIFTSKELEKATDRFNESRILGQGGQGTVYKGMISDGRIVAVKKSKLVDECQLVEFINEIAILSQVNHRNVVRLLGCCLETEVPLLVYEFIPNGTLYSLIHDQDTGIPFSWDIRFRIATEIAHALAYLHYATSVPIYHRDMKSTNILLDEKYRAKLSDFGISRSVAIDQTHLTTNVKGTFGYVDPEYFQTGKFTEKSDVYSFGVVLVELLTGKKPIATCLTEEERSLVVCFLSSMEENQLKKILDARITEQGVNEEHTGVAELAKRCLDLTGRKRPTIREVATELESIRRCENPSFVESNVQDISWSR
ncbi:hypothetical protein C2S52_008764 [Perilla frutescens var. hirtella]|nr:hypothetical protein C2S52_008764 [Perilla frutescens var. hirtella]